MLAELDALSATELLDLGPVARALGYAATPEALDTAVSPRGYRLLARVPRLPGAVIDRLVEHFGGLQKLLAASVDDLQAVEGVGEARARSVREACPGWPSPRSSSGTSEPLSARADRDTYAGLRRVSADRGLASGADPADQRVRPGADPGPGADALGLGAEPGPGDRERVHRAGVHHLQVALPLRVAVVAATTAAWRAR